MNLTEQFVEYLYETANVSLSDKDIHQAKRCVLDYLGASLAGAAMQRDKLLLLLSGLGSETGPCSVIGFENKTSAVTAALVNGMSAHVAEMDDGSRFGMMHPGAPIISAMFAAAQTHNLDGNSILRGIVIGYETAICLSSSIQPGHKERGFHATGTCGAIGAAVAVIAALKGTQIEYEAAIAAAATGASGLLKAIDDDSELKPLNVGRAACNGFVAAMTARAGFEPPQDVLGSHRGLFEVTTVKVHTESLIPNKLETLQIHNIYIKPYAACRHCHSAIEAALRLRAEHKIDPSSIKSIEVSTYKWAVGGHEHTDIEGISSAKMSIPYSVAAAFKLGFGNIKAFETDAVRDAEIVALTKKVSVVESEEMTGLVPSQRAAEVKIDTEKGRYSYRVDLPKGEPETALTDEDVKDKFRSLAGFFGLSKERTETVIQNVWNIEKDFHSLMTSLRTK